MPLALLGGGILLVSAGLFIGRPTFSRRPLPLNITIDSAPVPADGDRIVAATIVRPRGRRAQGAARVSILDNAHRASVLDVAEVEAGWRARIRLGVSPGRVRLRAEAPGFLPGEAEMTATLAADDSAGDGTPDFFRLEDEHDRQAFRRWFTFLAEAQYFRNPEARPLEIDDCAALIRYAYREALRQHDGSWARQADLPLLPSFESVAKYQYPYTPLGAALFRVRPGPFQPADIGGGAFAQFADARTLLRFNTHFLSRDVTRALPGDLLFYEQLSGDMPFHSMIFLGRSQIGSDPADYVLYHTGPDGKHAGELRRLTIEQLMTHPDPRWRPVEGNPIFLGVRRWNILRKAS